jgi:hypothetical protein
VDFEVGDASVKGATCSPRRSFHAWVEVRGRHAWVRFDPTPASDEEPLTPAQATRLLDAVRGNSATTFARAPDAGVPPSKPRDL